MIFVTGDTHGEFQRVKTLCEKAHTDQNDTLIILGDAGLNYYGGKRDRIRKTLVAAFPITLFCIHGNHEMRPESLPGYEKKEWHGGTVLFEPEFPSILFAVDGEIYDFEGKSTLVIGGAYSVDKEYRLSRGYGWWPDEQPSSATKQLVEEVLDKRGWTVDVVLSHTAPIKYEPREVFLPFIDQSKVDKSTEQWLGDVESKLSYGKWYCGHYHIAKSIDRMIFMFEDIRVWDE